MVRLNTAKILNMAHKLNFKDNNNRQFINKKMQLLENFKEENKKKKVKKEKLRKFLWNLRNLKN